MQECSVCGEEKDLEEFPIDRRAKSGYKKVCKSCFNEKYKDRNNKPLNVEREFVKYIKEKDDILYKALSIQAITEDREFLDVLLESIEPKEEFLNIVRNYKSDGEY